MDLTKEIKENTRDFKALIFLSLKDYIIIFEEGYYYAY